MELLEIFRLFKKERALFFGVTLGVLLLALLWQQAQGPRSEANLLLNVGRIGTQTTTEYTYDGFYRLQADERFADTVVRWLEAPRVVEDIYREAGFEGGVALKNGFQASRLSSQVIEVRYQHASEAVLERLAEALPVVLNRYTESLNRDTQEPNWFVLLGNEPVIEDARVPLEMALLVGLAAGLFLAFWVVLGRHYVRGQETKNREQ